MAAAKQYVRTPEPETGRSRGRLIRRQKPATRITHWLWALSVCFLIASGLQIFNTHPVLYAGAESGFAYENTLFEIRADQSGETPRGVTTIFGRSFDTTGLLGLSGPAGEENDIAFPAWLTIPPERDLATARVVHFFFAWVLLATLLAWFIASLINRHLQKDLAPRRRDFRTLAADALDHLRGTLQRHVRYSPLQKLAYAGVMFLLFPVSILSGLAMSPGMDAALPLLLDVFGGRQTARTVHFAGMLLTVVFLIVHIAMVLAAGPVNELRSMVTGRYRLHRRKGGAPS